MTFKLLLTEHATSFKGTWVSMTSVHFSLHCMCTNCPRSTPTAREQHTKHTKDVLPITKLLELEERAETLPDMDTPTHKQEVKLNQQKKSKAAAHHSQPAPVQVSSSRHNYVLCSGEKHSLYVCPTFNGMSAQVLGD